MFYVTSLLVLWSVTGFQSPSKMLPTNGAIIFGHSWKFFPLVALGGWVNVNSKASRAIIAARPRTAASGQGRAKASIVTPDGVTADSGLVWPRASVERPTSHQSMGAVGPATGT